MSSVASTPWLRKADVIASWKNSLSDVFDFWKGEFPKIDNGKAFAPLKGGLYSVDGLKVAEDGSVWVADAHGGRVAVFNADGTHRRDIAVPLPMVTSLCFAGDGLRDL